MLNTLVIIILCSAIAYCLLKKKIDLFQAYIFFIPFAQISMDIGLIVYLYQILLIGLAAVIFLSGRVILRNVSLYLFLVYAIVATLVISIFFIDTYMPMDGGFFRKEGRFYAQIVVFVMSFLAAFVASHYVDKKLSYMKYFKTYIVSVVILSQLGMFQGIMFNLLGYDIFPLSIVTANDIDGERPPGIWGRTLGFYVFRISSFAGEPKSLAIHVIAAYYIIDLFNRNNVRLFSQDSKMKLLLLATLVWTLSTGGYVLFLIIFFLFATLRFFSGRKLRFTLGSILVFSLGSSVILGFAYVFYDFISIVLNDRFLGRSLLQEDYDYVVQTFLSYNFDWIYFGSGLGNIHNLSFMYILPEKEYYMAGNIFVAKSGYLKLISELGLVGFTLFLTFNFVVFIKCGRLIKQLNGSANVPYLKGLRAVLLAGLVMYLARGYAFSVYIMLFSIINAAVYSREWRRVQVNI